MLVEGSIFGTDDKKINELLDYHVKLPEKNRIVILNLNTDTDQRSYANGFTQLSDSLVESLITRLGASS